MPDINRLRQICELFHVSSDELLEICPIADNRLEGVSESAQVLPNSEANLTRKRKKHTAWLCTCGVIVLLCACLVLLGARLPEEVRQAQALGIVPVESAGKLSRSVSEREFLTLLSSVCNTENGGLNEASASWMANATNERLTREKAAYLLYCAHILTKLDPNARLSTQIEEPLISQRNVYEEMNTLSRLSVDGMESPWEWGLCVELRQVGELFQVYDGTVGMDETINAILYGPYYTSVTFCLAQRSFINEKPLMETDGDLFRPKDEITWEEAVIAAYRLYGSW